MSRGCRTGLDESITQGIQQRERQQAPQPTHKKGKGRHTQCPTQLTAATLDPQYRKKAQTHTQHWQLRLARKGYNVMMTIALDRGAQHGTATSSGRGDRSAAKPEHNVTCAAIAVSPRALTAAPRGSKGSARHHAASCMYCLCFACPKRGGGASDTGCCAGVAVESFHGDATRA